MNRPSYFVTCKRWNGDATVSPVAPSVGFTIKVVPSNELASYSMLPGARFCRYVPRQTSRLHGTRCIAS